MIADSVSMGLLAALGFGLAEFASALLARRTSHFRLIFGVNVASVLAATAYVPFDGGVVRTSSQEWLTFIGLAVLYSMTYVLYYASLQRGPVAIVSPIMSVYKGVVIILAVLILAEPLAPGQSSGATAALLGVFLASINISELKGGRIVIGRGVFFGFLAMIAFGVFYYGVAALSKDLGWFLPIYMIRMFTAVFVAPLAIRQRPEPHQRLTTESPWPSSRSAPSKSAACSLSLGAPRWGMWLSSPPSRPPTPWSRSPAASPYSASVCTLSRFWGSHRSWWEYFY